MAFLKRLLGLEPSPAQAQAAELLDWVVRISRAPGFFGAGRAADTFEGRLEVVMAHGAVLVLRLRRDAADASLAQTFVDQYFRYLDASLREAGVGDLTVPKRMKKIAGSFYGRLQAYQEGLSDADATELAAALTRNVLGAAGASFAPEFATHLRGLATALQDLPPAEIPGLSIPTLAPIA